MGHLIKPSQLTKEKLAVQGLVMRACHEPKAVFCGVGKAHDFRYKK